MKVYLLVDFGSTYTKVTAIDLDAEVVIGRAQSPTTVEAGISIGLDRALEELRRSCAFDEGDVCGRYASSSAAGGLKMAAIGLVPDLTLNAARRAALGAGAKVVGAYGFEIDDAIVREIEEKDCDIIMLCGGTDGGNKDVIVHNAGMLAGSRIGCPVLVCGNRVVSGRISEMLASAGKTAYVADNVLPSVTEVNVVPAQNRIREIFIEHIIKAKGFDEAAGRFDRAIIPTPKASLVAAELLADGTENEPGIGSLLVVEVGGATTNVHSVADVVPFTKETIVRGLPESRVSRTVEGDLGIRYNARTIFELVGGERLRQLAGEAATLAVGSLADQIAVQTAGTLAEQTAGQATTQATCDPDATRDASQAPCDPDSYTRLLAETVEYVPQTSQEALMDVALAAAATGIAVERHAGELKTEFSAMGEVNIQYGKNLYGVKNILGTGGIFRYGARPEMILASALFSEKAPWSLKPRAPAQYVDADYLLYAIGLLSQEHPDAALRIMKRHLRKRNL